MPRKSNSSSNAKSQQKPSEKDPQPTLTDEPNTTDKESPNSRGASGQFAKGNAGGPGNPHARACAKMLQAFRDNITEEEMLQICRMLFVKAVGGDVSAAKIILSYKIGKPLPAPHPDSIDRDEWDHYQNDAIRQEEMKKVMSSLPTQAGNDIARVSLPIMTASRLNDFAAQLLDGLPVKRDEGGGMKDERKTKKSEPLANGKSGREHMKQREGTEEKGEDTNTKETPISNGKLGRKYAEKGDATNTKAKPLPNGKSECASAGQRTRNKVRNQWMQQVANRLNKKAKKEKAVV